MKPIKHTRLHQLRTLEVYAYPFFFLRCPHCSRRSESVPLNSKLPINSLKNRIANRWSLSIFCINDLRLPYNKANLHTHGFLRRLKCQGVTRWMLSHVICVIHALSIGVTLRSTHDHFDVRSSLPIGLVVQGRVLLCFRCQCKGMNRLRNLSQVDPGSSGASAFIFSQRGPSRITPVGLKPKRTRHLEPHPAPCRAHTFRRENTH